MRFICPSGHADEATVASLLMRHDWATPLAEIAAKALCSSCGGREVTITPIWAGSLLGPG